MALCLNSRIAKQFARALENPEFRQLLREDPVRALEQARIKPDAIPEEHLKVFSELSTDELELLGKIAMKFHS